MRITHFNGLQSLLYERTLAGAVTHARELMPRLVAAARESLLKQEREVRGLFQRDLITLSRTLLDQHEPVLCERCVALLLAGFSGVTPEDSALGGDSMVLTFQQLELMDESQILERIEVERSLQLVVAASDAALMELNPLICSLLGLASVQMNANPLSPQAYVRCLQVAVAELPIKPGVSANWMRPMCEALGRELKDFYEELTRKLKKEGVSAASYVVVQSSASSSQGRGPQDGQNEPTGRTAVSRTPVRVRGVRDDTSLTLEKLRKLLSGELDQLPVAVQEESFAERFSREFDQPPGPPAEAQVSDFYPTVPAAFEALTEMKQVDKVLADIKSRRGRDPSVAEPGSDAVLETLRRQAKGLGQALSLEVVTLMVRDMASDVRLLAPIQQVVKALGPALLRLAMVDPRFFSDKKHPARSLLSEMTDRSLAFETEDAMGFQDFLAPLQVQVAQLSGRLIDNSEPFSEALHVLVQGWEQRRKDDRIQVDAAVQALEKVDARNRHAMTSAQEILHRPDIGHIPIQVVEFLRGPWAQVIAHSSMGNTTGSPDPGGYSELVGRLIWSARPELTRRSPAELAALIPKMIAKLREGLDAIQYPPEHTSAFFDVLMALHQQALRPVKAAVEADQAPSSVPPANSEIRPLLEEGDNLWMAPMEAKVSGFMEFTEGDADFAQSNLPAAAMPPVGSWVELKVNDRWIRTQLTWASPHGTLFLFTGASGNTQSMTSRMRDKLIQNGQLRIIADQPMVDGALDAVARSAMLNSVDNRS